MECLFPPSISIKNLHSFNKVFFSSYYTVLGNECYDRTRMFAWRQYVDIIINRNPVAKHMDKCMKRS